MRILSYTGPLYGFCGLAALLDVFAIYLHIGACMASSSSFIALLEYMRIVWAYVADTFIFHQKLKNVQLVAALTIIVVLVSVAVYRIVIKERKEEAANNGEFVRYSDIDDNNSASEPHPPTLVTQK